MKRHSTNWVNSRSADLQERDNTKVRTQLLFQGLLLGALVLTSPVSATAQAIKTTIKELIATAQTERVLTTHQSGRFGNPALWHDVQAAMKAKYGIDVQLNGSPAATSTMLPLNAAIGISPEVTRPSWPVRKVPAAQHGPDALRPDR